MIPLQVLSALWFPYSSGDSFSTCSMMSLTLVCVPLGDWSLQSLSGLAFLVTLGLWAKSCHQCQRSKISTHVNFSVPAIPVPTQRFSYIHIDIVGPLPSSQGFNYLVTIINRTTQWPEVAPLSSILAESCTHAFLSTWISRFGIPAVLTYDRGAQFTSSVWAGVCSSLGISASATNAFHPQSNGMIERFHRSQVCSPFLVGWFGLIFPPALGSLGSPDCS